MTTGAERERRRDRTFPRLTAACLLLAAGCRKTPPAESSSDLASACASACAVLVSSGCFGDSEPTRAQRECVAGCRATESAVQVANCLNAKLSWLGCIGHSERVSCAAERSARDLFEKPPPISACEREQRAFSRCSRPCREPGVIHEATKAVRRGDRERQVAAELVELGCEGTGGAPGQRSPAGAPCTHHSVCTPALCRCDGPGAYLARACVDGRCADAALACSIVPETVGQDVCGHGLTHGELTPPTFRR
jgi:hypothetical protein